MPCTLAEESHDRPRRPGASYMQAGYQTAKDAPVRRTAVVAWGQAKSCPEPRYGRANEVSCICLDFRLNRFRPHITTASASLGLQHAATTHSRVGPILRLKPALLHRCAAPAECAAEPKCSVVSWRAGALARLEVRRRRRLGAGQVARPPRVHLFVLPPLVPAALSWPLSTARARAA